MVLESTTYPGTTTEELRPVLEKLSGLKTGKGFFLAFSPEREDPGNPKYKTADIPKVVGGLSSQATELAAALYQTIFRSVVRVSAPAVAEMTKLLENIYRCVNIALVNELKLLCLRI